MTLAIRESFILVGYSDGTICIFSLKNPLPLFRLPSFHTSEVVSLCFYNPPSPLRPFGTLADVMFLSCGREDTLKLTRFQKKFLSGFKSSSEDFPDLFEYSEILKDSMNLQAALPKQ